MPQKDPVVTDDDEELNIDDADENEDGGDPEPEDRGDVIDPEVTAENLAAELGDEDDEPAGGGRQRSGFVPHARFNEVNEGLKQARQRAEQLEAEIAELRGGAAKAGQAQPKAETYDFEAAYERHAQALVDGEVKEAARIQREIDAESRKVIKAEAEAEIEQRLSKRDQDQRQKTEQELASQAAQAAYAKYPFLNHESDDANTDAIDEVIALRDHYVKKGDTLSVALGKAIEKVGPRYGEPDAGPKAETPTKDKTAREILAERKKASIQRNAEHSQRQPPRADGGRGNRADVDEIDVESMGEADFARLPDKEKRRLRGDIV